MSETTSFFFQCFTHKIGKIRTKKDENFIFNAKNENSIGVLTVHRTYNSLRETAKKDIFQI